MASSIVEIVGQTAVISPEKLCIVDEKKEYTYLEIWEKAISAAVRLQKQSVKKCDCILVECNQQAEYMICNFACNLLGAYFVPVEKDASLDRVKSILEETEATLMIADTQYEISVPIISFGEIMSFQITEAEKAIQWQFPKGEDTAEILYTTGTTGKSKGIEITHANNIAIAENISYGTQMIEGNVELIPLPLSHSHGLRCAYANFFSKGTIVITDGIMKVKYIYDAIKKYNVTALDLSPTAAAVLLKLTRGKFSEFNGQLHYIQIGTAALPEETKQALCEQFPNLRLYNFYGSTESGRSCALNFNSEDDRKYCIGHPTHNATFIITDDDRNPIVSDKDHTGLIACAGAMNMKGYWKQLELTEQIMRNGYVYTNDEGYIDERGFLYVLGRKDDIINYKGIKIAPEEIEEVVLLYPGVTDCACIPKADKTAGQVPKVFLVMDAKAEFNQTAFMQFMEAHVDGNKLPKHIEIIDQIPRATNGKIQRKKLVTQESEKS